MGKLVQVDTFTVSSAVASVTLGGGSSGSSGLNASINTDDVYMATVLGWYGTVSGQGFHMRVTKSGTPDTTANYDYAQKRIRANSAFSNDSSVNGTSFTTFGVLGHSQTRPVNQIFYLYNFNSSSEYSFITYVGSSWYGSVDNQLFGTNGGAVHTVASASDGLQFYMASGNIDVGSQFTLYKVL